MFKPTIFTDVKPHLKDMIAAAKLAGYHQAVSDELAWLDKLVTLTNDLPVLEAIRARCKAITSARVCDNGKGAFWA